MKINRTTHLIFLETFLLLSKKVHNSFTIVTIGLFTDGSLSELRLPHK